MQPMRARNKRMLVKRAYDEWLREFWENILGLDHYLAHFEESEWN